MSIEYNSQGGNGIAGFGTSIGGLSVITRVPKDLFHDQTSSGISYTAADALSLDGKRLILKSGTPGADGAVYTVEGDPYTTVTANVGPDNTWFEVLTPGGLKYIYGSANGSQQTFLRNGSLVTSAWYLSKITNAQNEEVEFSYEHDQYFVYLKKIQYGPYGNESIELTYEGRTDAEPFRLDNKPGQMGRRLKNVTSKSGTNVYRQYILSYIMDADSTDRCYSRLSSVVEKNGGGEQLPPILAEWRGLPPATPTVEAVDATPVSLQGGTSITSRQFMASDLTGDGLSDLCEKIEYTSNGSKHAFIKIHRNESSAGTFHALPQYDIAADYNYGNYALFSVTQGLNGSDIDGDGINDLVLLKQGNQSVSIGYIPGLVIKMSGSCGFNCLDISVSGSAGATNHVLADIDNDGRAEVLFVDRSPVSNSTYKCRMVRYDSASPHYSRLLHDSCTVSLSSTPQTVFTADYNNDGLQDLIVFYEGGYKVFFNNGCGTHQTSPPFSNSNSFTGTSIGYTRHMYQGDFNGDGLTDFVYNIPGEAKYYFALNNGDGTFSNMQACELNGVFDKTGTLKDDDRFSFLVYDADHDGKSDLVIVKAYYEYHGTPSWSYGFDHTDICWLRSTGTTLVLKRKTRTYDEDDARAYNLMPGDFTGNGEVQLINYGSHLRTNVVATAAEAPGIVLAEGETLIIEEETEYAGDEPQETADAELPDETADGGTDGDTLRDAATIKPLWLYLKPSFTPASGKLTALTDGFGNRTSVSYASLVGSSIYTPGSGASYPVADLTVPLHVVSGTLAGNGAAGTAVMSYAYGGLKAHLRGRGLIGFSATSVTDVNAAGITATVLDSLNLQWFVPQRATTTTTQGSCTATSVLRQTIYTPQYGNYWLHPDTKTDTDIWGNETVTTYAFDCAHGDPLTEHTAYGSPAMYRETRWSGYTESGWRRQPANVTVEQRHEDDTAPFSTTTHYTYNGHGMPLHVTEHYGTSLALTHSYTYNNSGHVTSENTTGSGITPLTTQYSRNIWNQVTGTATTPASVSMSYEYDAFGRLITETDHTDSSSPLVTSYTYDGWGNLSQTITPDGLSTTVSRGWGSTPDRRYYVYQTASGQPWQRTWYDSRGRETLTETVGPGGAMERDTTYYNSRGLVSSKVSTSGQLAVTQTMSYDALGRLSSTVSSNGQSTSLSYGNRVQTTTDAAGRSRTRYFDAWGNVTEASDPLSGVSYTYSSCGKPATATVGNSTVSMEYDGCGNQTSLDDPDAGTTTYTYDAAGRVVSQTDARGIISATAYDAFGRTTQHTAGTDVTTYTYGTSGAENMLLTGMANATGTIGYTHDPYGRLLTETRTLTGGSPLTFSYTYNSLGQLSSKSYPDNVTATYQYDGNGHEYQMSVNDTVVWQLQGNNGLVRTENLGGGALTRTQTHDPQGYLTALATQHGQTSVSSMTFGYDTQTGNLTERTGMQLFGDSFQYDSLDRLKKVSAQIGPVGPMTKARPRVINVTYDSNGNILSKTGTGSYDYDGPRPHAVTETDMLGSADSIGVAYTYNALGKIGRMEKGVPGDSTIATFEYGPDGERWKCTVTNILHLFGQRRTDVCRSTYAGDYEEIYHSLLTDYPGTSKYYNLGHGVIYWKHLSQPILQQPQTVKTRVLYACTDNLGSIMRLVDGQGNVVFKASYDAWGNQTIQTDSIGFRRGFTGHEHIPEFGLINMNGRLYDPATGTFLSPDNYVQAPYNSQSFNRYSYCLNNPLKYTDPSGEYALLDDILAAVLGGTTNLIINLVDGNVQNIYQGLLSFGAGAVGGIGALYPEFGGLIWGGAIVGGTNAALAGADTQGIVSGSLSGISSSLLGGIIGEYAAGYGSVIINGTNIASPVLKGFLSGSVGGSVGGYLTGFICTFITTGSLEEANESGLYGALIGAVSGAISGGLSGYQYAKEHNISPWKGEKIQKHHSFPKFLGGDFDQPLSPMNESRHIDLHRDLNKYLHNSDIERGDGFKMLPTRGNSGRDIQKKVPLDMRFNSIKSFYDAYPYKYFDIRRDFYMNNGLKWKPWPQNNK